jgi:hypothetical protein
MEGWVERLEQMQTTGPDKRFKLPFHVNCLPSFSVKCLASLSTSSSSEKQRQFNMDKVMWAFKEAPK